MTKKTLLVCAALFLGAAAWVAWKGLEGSSVLLILVALACPLMHVFMHRGHGHGHSHAGHRPPGPGPEGPRPGA